MNITELLRNAGLDFRSGADREAIVDIPGTGCYGYLSAFGSSIWCEIFDPYAEAAVCSGVRPDLNSALKYAKFQARLYEATVDSIHFIRP